MHKHILLTALLAFSAIFTLTNAASAAEPAVFTGKPAIEASRVELFARTMAIAQGKASAATSALNDKTNSPENASSTHQAVEAIKNVLELGSGILNAEKNACEQTGMSQADFHEVKTRLLQVRMLQNMDSLKSSMIGKQSGNEMAGESMTKIDKQLAGLEARLQKSREALDKAKADEPDYFARQDKKIAELKTKIAKLQSESGTEPNAKKREAKQKQLTSAREKLSKLESDRQKPYKTLINAQERVEKDEKSVAVFRENMAAAKKQLETMGQEIQQYQENMSEGFARTENSDIFKQAALDLPVFQQFPDLKPFLAGPGK
ncbi:MAG: hypothetical protein PHD82_02620 [Candidatus Riflebacteria bacterium]|nr:hypothetical protein [Candidatus Riflebacteria bacterium]